LLYLVFGNRAVPLPVLHRDMIPPVHVINDRGAKRRRITDDFFNKKQGEYRDKQKLIEERLVNLREADEEYYLTATNILKVANRAPEIFEGSEPAAKRQILKILLQNCVVNDATLVPTIRSPFSLLAKGASRHKWLPLVNEFRNWLCNSEEVEFLKILLKGLPFTLA